MTKILSVAIWREERMKDKLQKLADPDCVICDGSGVVDTGPSDTEELAACVCVELPDEEDDRG